MQYKNQAFGADDRVTLAGNVFNDCSFYRVTFEYSGGPLYELNNCRLEDCELKLLGAANRTTEVLRRVARRGGSQAVLTLLAIDPI
jgi:hypothetical protein